MQNKQNLFHRVTVPAAAAGLRLDRFLATLEFISSRSRGSELIHQGLVKSAGKTLKASYRVQLGENIDVTLPPIEPTALQPLDAPLTILFEDDDLIVINKPSGLVVHPAAGHAQDTLVNMLLHHCRQLSMGFSENRPGIVHRLDRDTSGILVVAKNDHAHHSLAEQFRVKSVRRLYWALVHGRLAPASKTIRSHLARHPSDRKRFASNPLGKGKLAITHVQQLQTLPSEISWLQCRLETGRTHQIRVHLSENGTAIIGDPIYGSHRRLPQKVLQLNEGQMRLCLHAFELGFTHPRTHEDKLFQVGWPGDLQPIVNALGFKNV